MPFFNVIVLLDLLFCAVCPLGFTGTEKYMQTLTWSGMTDFNAAPNKPIMVNKEVGLFHQQYEHLNFFSVMKAGHMVSGCFSRCAHLTRTVGMHAIFHQLQACLWWEMSLFFPVYNVH